MSKTFFAPPALEIIHLSGPSPGTPECQMNLVLVHGIDGDHVSTWASQSTDTPWYDTLTSTFNGLSVSAVDIPYTHLKWFSGNEKYLEHLSIPFLEKLIERHILDRPTMFLCHSLGGILFKKALTDGLNGLNNATGVSLDRRKANWRKVAFIGVPHNGSPWAKTWIAKFLIIMRSETSRDLKPGKRFLVAVDDGFTRSIKRYPFCSVHSFHETKPIWQDRKFWVIGPLLRRIARFYGPIVPQDYSTLRNVQTSDNQIEACHFQVSKIDLPHAATILDLVTTFCTDCSSNNRERAYLFKD